jgi:hypothetical protein
VRHVDTRSVAAVIIWRKLRSETFLEISLVGAWLDGCGGTLLSVELRADFLSVLYKEALVNSMRCFLK